MRAKPTRGGRTAFMGKESKKEEKAEMKKAGGSMAKYKAMEKKMEGKKSTSRKK